VIRRDWKAESQRKREHGEARGPKSTKEKKENRGGTRQRRGVWKEPITGNAKKGQVRGGSTETIISRASPWRGREGVTKKRGGYLELNWKLIVPYRLTGFKRETKKEEGRMLKKP